jgi:hypothetical protein
MSASGGSTARAIASLLVVLTATGCVPDEPLFEGVEADTLPPFGEVVAEAPAAHGIDREVLRRNADQMDRHALELRQHVGVMRQISPRMAGTVMEEHTAHVRALGERVREQRAALPVPDERLPELLGMSPDEYRVMLEEVETAAVEVAELQAADEALIREQLPGHLDRLDRIAAQLEHGAASLRR